MAGSTPRVELVVITGLSGSGRTTAIRALEDAGWFCVDNLPAPLLEAFLRLADENKSIDRVGVAMDVRESGWSPDLKATLVHVRAQGHPMRVLFLDADDDRLIARYKETRRRHPLIASGQAHTVPEAIALERAWLAPVQHLAAAVLDTTTMTVHDLKREVQARFAGPLEKRMSIHLLSFGYRHGLPPEADMVFDVRFLKNPYFVDALQPLRGDAEEVSRFVLEQPAAIRFLEHVTGLLVEFLPLAESEGRATMTIAIGCTGGHHRSVAMVRALGERLAVRGFEARTSHRDVER